ncbi:MAG: TIGR04086 family membrane protein [Clostridia bacterium]|nr:TIGR04086 family membrane protein [Clostridia bacterium]
MAKKKLIKSSSKIVNIALSTLFGVFSAVIILMLCAFVLVKNDIPSEYIKFFWIPVSIVSGLISGLLAGKLTQSRGIIWGSLSSLIVAVIAFLTIFIFNSFSINLLTFLIIPLTVLFGAVGGIISSNLK